MLKERRGSGVGKALIIRGEEHIRSLGAEAVIIHAQEHAAPFYERLGYIECGDRELEQGRVHVPMKKSFSAAKEDAQTDDITSEGTPKEEAVKEEAVTDNSLKEEKPKRHLGLIITAAILASVILFFAVINIIPPKKNVDSNPFIVLDGELPMIAAHRGGGDNNPENTMLAFREAVREIGVDIIESDLYLTKDGYLVYNHDSYIDETCNVNGDISLDEVEELCKTKSNRHYIKDMTLAELEQYNFGYYFEDENGDRIYKDETDPALTGLQIATVEKLFSEFYESHPDLLFIVEIKDSGERGYEAARILNDTLNNYPKYRDNIVVGTFHDEIEAELKDKYSDLLRGAPTGTAAGFIITQLLLVNIFNDSDFACLQIPMSYDIGIELPLDQKTLIDRAHRRNIAVQYWTINDPDEMRRLIELGCDAIMTDDPKLLKEVLEEYK